MKEDTGLLELYYVAVEEQVFVKKTHKDSGAPFCLSQETSTIFLSARFFRPLILSRCRVTVELLSSYCRVTVELLQTVGPDRGVQTLVKRF